MTETVSSTGAAFQTLVNARVNEARARSGGASRVANTGRFSLDDMESIEAQDLQVGEVFIHDGRAYSVLSEFPRLTVLPWGGEQPERLAIGELATVALLS